MRLALIAMALAALHATPALAEFARIDDRDAFVRLVAGRDLTRPLVRLRVGADGAITGRGASWDVTGAWVWRDGFFCRDLNWGGDDLGYNCQLVQARGDRIRFVSDRGSGQSAEFRLN